MIQHDFVIFCHNVHLFAREINGSEVQTNFPVVPISPKESDASHLRSHVARWSSNRWGFSRRCHVSGWCWGDLWTAAQIQSYQVEPGFAGLKTVDFAWFWNVRSIRPLGSKLTGVPMIGCSPGWNQQPVGVQKTSRSKFNQEIEWFPRVSCVHRKYGASLGRGTACTSMLQFSSRKPACFRAFRMIRKLLRS